MKPIQIKAAILSVSILSAVTAAGAESTSFSSLQQAAEKSYGQNQYKRAETSLLKAFDAAQTDGTKEIDVARARVLLAKIYRETKRPQKSNEQLELALAVYKRLGFVEPVFAEERAALFKDYKQVDPSTLGRGYDLLKNNSAVISIQRKDTGAHVEFTMPAPVEKSLINPKVDGFQFDAVVAFDIVTEGDGKVHASNIKGFKIHSVEKNTWANLLDLSVGGAVNSEGTHDAQIVAGKGGFTKTVAAKLPEKAYEPVVTIANQITRFDTPPALDLPIAAAATESTPTATSVTTVAPSAGAPAITNSAPSWSSTTSAPVTTSPHISTPAVSAPLVSAPVVPADTSPVEATTNAAPETKITRIESHSFEDSQSEKRQDRKGEVKAKHDDDDDDDKKDEVRKERRREASAESMNSKKHADKDDDDDDDDDDNDDKHKDKDRD